MKQILSESLSLIQKSGYLIALTAITIFYISIDFLKSWFIILISDGKIEYITYYIIIELLMPFIDSLITTVRIDARFKIAELFLESEYNKYNNLSFLSKNQSTPDDFRRNLIDAYNSIDLIIDWGLPELINVCSSICSSIFIFYSKNMYLSGIIIIFINILSYFILIKKMQKQYFDARESRKKENDKLYNLIILNLPMFRQKEISPNKIIENDLKIIHNHGLDHKNWHKIVTVTNLTNRIPLLILLCQNDNTKILLLLNVLSQINNSVASLMSFLNQSNRILSNYSTYIDFWKNLEFKEEPTALPLPISINITDLNITLDNFTLKFTPSISSISIKQNDKILIKGPSGHGKSTFINSLLGKINGLTLDENKPENYFHHYIEFYQSIKENLPTSTITVRQIFDSDSNDDTIINCCKLCLIDDWISNLSIVDCNNHIIDIHSQNPLDIEINERISGGQKTRLALATRIYRMLKSNKSILILDEPEQGLDPPIAYKIIDNIINKFSNKTIIIISHLELISNKRNWNKVIYIEKGNVNLLY